MFIVYYHDIDHVYYFQQSFVAQINCMNELYNSYN